MLGGQIIHKVRQAMGRQLAREAPADADVVVPVPDSAVPSRDRLQPRSRA